MKEIHILFCIFIASFIIFCLNLNFNGVFVDEVYYILVGKSVVSGGLTNVVGEPLEVMFGFIVAPIILYLGDYIGGFLVARAINSLFISGTLVIIYLITKKIFNDRKVSLISVFLSLSFSPIFFIARFATHDAPSLFFLSLSILVALESISEKNSEKSVNKMLASSFLLFISFICKYTSILAFPALFLLLLFKKGKISVHFFAPFSALVIFYAVLFYRHLNVLFSSQFYTQTGFVFDISIVIFILLLPYTILFYFSGERKLRIFFILGAVSIIAFQMLLTNYVNTFKHAAFAFIFIVPFASYGFYRLISRIRKYKIKFFLEVAKNYIVFSIVIVLIISSFFASKYFIENFYINEERASGVLDNIIVKGDSVLAYGHAFAYYTKKLPPEKVFNNFWFDYDNDGKCNEIDYKNAIKDGYFGAIMVTSILSKFPIEDYLNGSSYKIYYEEIHNLSYGNKYLRIYVPEK